MLHWKGCPGDQSMQQVFGECCPAAKCCPPETAMNLKRRSCAREFTTPRSGRCSLSAPSPAPPGSYQADVLRLLRHVTATPYRLEAGEGALVEVCHGDFPQDTHRHLIPRLDHATESARIVNKKTSPRSMQLQLTCPDGSEEKLAGGTPGPQRNQNADFYVF